MSSMCTCAFAPPTRRSNKGVEIAVAGPLISNNQDVVVDAALQGPGVLYADDVDRIDDAISRGLLKRVLTDWSLTSPGLYLYLFESSPSAACAARLH